MELQKKPESQIVLNNESMIEIVCTQAFKTWNEEGLLSALLDPVPQVRFTAARELQSRCSENALDKVISSLTNSNSAEIREIMVFTLGQYGTPSYPYKHKIFPHLIRAVEDSSGLVRSAAAAGLGHLCHDGMPELVEKALLNLKQDIDANVRACAAFALGHSSGSDEVRETLDDLQNDPSETVRDFAKLGVELLED